MYAHARTSVLILEDVGTWICRSATQAGKLGFVGDFAWDARAPLTLVDYLLKVGVRIRNAQHARILWEQQEKQRLSHSHHTEDGALMSHIRGKQIKCRSAVRLILLFP